jgi:hypothetical protein
MEHSPTSATGTGWERTPWHVIQRVAWEALRLIHTEVGYRSVNRPRRSSHESHEITALDRLSRDRGDDGAADEAVPVG